ncbi:MAG: amidohydrolase family protein [Anaerolineae bacterium]|nr:amidohydrolase family protein [Anaerolineae bacterium]
MSGYPWPDPPARESAVVRLRPGTCPDDGAVLTWEGERFTGLRPADADERRHVHSDPNVFATPGLFDVQINGFWGRGFKDLGGVETIRDLCWSILLSGATHFLPTITTDALDTMAEAMRQIDAACRMYPDVAAMVAGIHQEGPWISPDDGPRGAHPRPHVRPPGLRDFERLQEASGNRIRLLTLAPEIDGALGFIDEVARRQITVCLGHHNADSEIIRRAVEAGARGVTHLGNGCHNVMPRHPNILWEQAAEDRLYAGLIADGHHLPPATVKVLARAKPRNKLFLVSDAVEMAGAPPGLYHHLDRIAEMSPEGRFGFYQSPTLIGAAVPLARCLANFTTFMDDGKTPVDHLDLVTKNPCRLLGLPAMSFGAPGALATFVLWRWEPQMPNLVPQRIVLLGRTLFDAEMTPIQVPFGHTAQPLTPPQTP